MFKTIAIRQNSCLFNRHISKFQVKIVETLARIFKPYSIEKLFDCDLPELIVNLSEWEGAIDHVHQLFPTLSEIPVRTCHSPVELVPRTIKGKIYQFISFFKVSFKLILLLLSYPLWRSTYLKNKQKQKNGITLNQLKTFYKVNIPFDIINKVISNLGWQNRISFDKNTGFFTFYDCFYPSEVDIFIKALAIEGYSAEYLHYLMPLQLISLSENNVPTNLSEKIRIVGHEHGHAIYKRLSEEKKSIVIKYFGNFIPISMEDLKQFLRLSISWITGAIEMILNSVTNNLRNGPNKPNNFLRIKTPFTEDIERILNKYETQLGYCTRGGITKPIFYYDHSTNELVLDLDPAYYKNILMVAEHGNLYSLYSQSNDNIIQKVSNPEEINIPSFSEQEIREVKHWLSRIVLQDKVISELAQAIPSESSRNALIKESQRRYHYKRKFGLGSYRHKPIIFVDFSKRLRWIKVHIAMEKFADYVGYYCSPELRRKIPKRHLRILKQLGIII